MAKFPHDDDLRTVELYFARELDAAGVAAFEDRLKNDAQLRSFFVEYANLELSIKKLVRDQHSLSTVLQELDSRPRKTDSPNAPQIGRLAKLAIAASLLLAFCGVGWWFGFGESSSVAWVVNAQNCRWDQSAAYRGRFAEGQVIDVRDGLLEIGFASSASLVVEGPASLKIISDSRVGLLNGAIAVKMPKGLAGFEVDTPNGRVLDLGTEFGVSVIDGNVDLAVFDGEVMAIPASENREVLLKENESASLDSEAVRLGESSHDYVREISSKIPKARSLIFNFESDEPSGGEVKDSKGNVTGLSRLNGTGDALKECDENLQLDNSAGILSITATRSDINRQSNLNIGEYLGRNLSELGFTGAEDFEVVMRVVDAPELPGNRLCAQYGLYVAKDTETCIRGGVILWKKPDGYRQFLVNTLDGNDRDGNRLGYISPGSNIEITLRRIAGKFSLEIRDLDKENSNILKIKHPEFLDSSSDFEVGIFVANPFHNDHATIKVDFFKATVWHEMRTINE